MDVTRVALDADTTTTVNRYWVDHPDHVLGTVEPGGAYRRENFTVTSDAARPHRAPWRTRRCRVFVGADRGGTGDRRSRTSGHANLDGAGVAGRIDHHRPGVIERVLP